MTIREAFEKAGMKIPVGAQIVCYTSDSGGFMWCYGATGSVEFMKLARPNHPYPESYLYGAQINLANLPAKDAIDALPETVKKVVT